MKVSCDICEAHYNIDESKIPATGLAVKCTKCKHLFIVRPPEPIASAIDATEIGELIDDSSEDNSHSPKEETVPQKQKTREPQPEPEPYWTLTRPDGHTFNVPDNATLQRWIVENKAAENDKLSKDGQTYQKLGEIEDYKSFFDIVRKKQEDIEKEQEEKAQKVKEKEEQQQQTEPLAVSENDKEQEEPQPITKTQTFIAQQPEQAEESVAPQEPTEPKVEEQPKEKQIEEPTQVKAEPETTKTEKTVSDDKDEKELGNFPDSGSSDEKVLGQTDKFANKQEGWSTTGEFSEWNEMADDDSEFASKSKVGKIIIILVILLAIAAGATYYMKPELINQFMGSGLNEAETKILEKAKNDVNLFTSASLQKAEETALNLKKRNDSMIDIIVLMADIYLTRAELLQYDVVPLEEKQAEINDKTRDAKIALEQSKGKKPELEKTLEDMIAAQKEINEQVLQATEKFNKAKKSAFVFVEEANTKHPQAFETFRALAAYYTLGKETGKANEFLEKAQKLNAEDANAIAIKGYLYALDKALSKEAHETLQMAAMKNPDMIKAKIREAALFMEEENSEAARNILMGILANQPDHPAAKAMLARLPQKKEQAEPQKEAEKTATQTEEKKEASTPQTYESLIQTAEKLRRTDRTRQALAYYQKAAKLQSTVAVASGLGYCYLDLENMQGALDQFKKALGKNKTHADSLFGLATTYEVLGNNANAIKYYKRYLKYNPKGVDAKAAQHSLERLKQ